MHKKTSSVVALVVVLILSLLPTSPSFGAFVGNYYPAVASDSVNNRYLLVYDKALPSTGRHHAYGRLINSTGSDHGSEFAISSAGGDLTMPSVAYDKLNKRFLVAWTDSRDDTRYLTYGQLVNADGSLRGENFVISHGSDIQWYPAVSYDSINQRFLVVWQDYRAESGTYGQLVNADGSLYKTASDINFPISNASFSAGNPSLAFDEVNQRFLVAWQDYRSGDADVYGQIVNADGSLYNTANFVISDASSEQSPPSVAFDNVDERFLVV